MNELTDRLQYAGRNARRKPKRKADTQKRYEYQARGFLKRMYLESVWDVEQYHVDLFRETTDLSPVTINNYVKAVGILTEQKFDGEELHEPQKRPNLVSLEDISRVYLSSHRGSWMRRFLRYAYITGLRTGDLMNLKRSDVHKDVIEVTAQKTGKKHFFPRHFVLQYYLPNSEYLFRKNSKTLLKNLRRYCDKAKVPHFTPRMIRRTAANEYEKAHAGAGGVLLGHSLSSVTMTYYVDQFEILKAAQLGLRVPDAFLSKSQRLRRRLQNKQLIEVFDKLPEIERKALISMISRSTKKR